MLKFNNMWGKRYHTNSSLERKNGQFSLFIGRWQPLHDGHKAMFQRALDEGENVCIGIRDVTADEKNPFSALEVFKNITEFYSDLIEIGKIRVIILPDIASVEFGRGVGYDIIEHLPPNDIADISATKIREEMRKEGKL